MNGLDLCTPHAQPQSMTGEETKQQGWHAILRRKLATMAAQPPAVLALVPLCWVLIAISDIIILAVPFRRVAPWAGQAMGTAATIPVTTPRQQHLAQTIGQAIGIAARAAPFRADCYPQALTAVALCRCARVPTALFFGATLSADDGGSGLEAHAWVVSGPVTITGGKSSFGRFKALACFLRVG